MPSVRFWRRVFFQEGMLIMKRIFAAVFILALMAVTAEGFDRKELIERAFSAIHNSYAPYSHFNVASAVLCSSGKIYTGVNVENASYSAGICSERTAIVHAVAEGEREIVAIAIIGGPGGKITNYCPPCGICRQFMREFCDPEKFIVILAKSPDEWIEMTLAQLLPMSFGPDHLKH